MVYVYGLLFVEEEVPCVDLVVLPDPVVALVVPFPDVPVDGFLVEALCSEHNLDNSVSVIERSASHVLNSEPSTPAPN